MGISLVALLLAMRGVAWRDLWAALAEADYRALVPAFLALALSMAARVVRWQRLLGPDVGFQASADAMGVGYLFSNLLPFRAGDLVRPLLIGLWTPVPATQALSTVVVERVLDLLMVFLMMVGLLLTMALPAWMVRSGLVAGGAAMGTLGGLVWLAGQGERGERLLRRLLARLSVPRPLRRWGGRLPFPRRLRRQDPEAWVRWLWGGIAGLAVLRQRQMGVILFWSALVWLSALGIPYFTLVAFRPHPPLAAGGLVLVLTNLGLAIPASPGSLGVYHFLAREALVTPFGVPEAQAMGFALVLHTFQYVSLCLWGLVVLARRSLSWQGLRAKVQAE